MEMSIKGIDQHSTTDAFRTHDPIHLHVCLQSSNIFHLFVHMCLCVILRSFVPSFTCLFLELLIHHGPLQQVELLAQDHHH